MNNIKNILKITAALLIIIVICTLFINKENIVDKLYIRFLIIKSGSMYPTLDVNDIILIRKTNQYEIGDIITYDYKSKYLITHRIVEIKENSFITKGDNNNSEDLESVEIQNVKGKEILIIKNKYLKYMIIFLEIILLLKIIKKGKHNETNN